MLKRLIITTFLILTISVFFIGCSFHSEEVNESDKQISIEREDENTIMYILLKNLEDENKEVIKSLFSQTAIDSSENFDSSIDELMELYKGKFILFDDKSYLNIEDTINGSDRLKIIYSTYNVNTNEQMYRIATKDVVIDTKNEENVGILSLYIIKIEDDTNSEYNYIGDGKFTPGINLNVKNVITNEQAE